MRDGKAEVGLIHAAGSWQLVGKTDVKSSVTVSVTESVRDRTLLRTRRAQGPRSRP